jgi:DNA polymerase-3 subunit delta
MSVDSIINSWKKNKFSPLNLFHGEEDFFIDELISFAEGKILTPEEASFNLTVFYGKDAEWTQVVNACKRYPMNADRQVVILKEAQMMNGIDKLEAYTENPLATTLFIIAHKGKTMDKRTRVYKLIDKSGTIFLSNKVPEYQLPKWIEDYVSAKGIGISSKAISMMASHIGNELSRVVNELDKLSINIKNKTQIDESDIEKYVGISREFNVFELQNAIMNKDMATALKIVQYFEATPKENPIHKILPALYAFVSKLHAAYGLPNKTEQDLRALFYNNSSAAKQASVAMKNYGYAGVERMILLLQHYNLKSLGMGDTGTEDASLMKEMVVKMMI